MTLLVAACIEVRASSKLTRRNYKEADPEGGVGGGVLGKRSHQIVSIAIIL